MGNQVRQMPPHTSRRWWKLWYAGAIPRDVVFFNALADHIEEQQRKDEARGIADGYYSSIDTSRIRKGLPLASWTRGLTDSCAFVFQNMRLHVSDKSYDQYDRWVAQLCGKYWRDRWENRDIHDWSPRACAERAALSELMGTPFSQAQYAVGGGYADGKGGGVLAWARDLDHARRIYQYCKDRGDTNLKIEIAPGGNWTGKYVDLNGKPIEEAAHS